MSPDPIGTSLFARLRAWWTVRNTPTLAEKPKPTLTPPTRLLNIAWAPQTDLAAEARTWERVDLDGCTLNETYLVGSNLRRVAAFVTHFNDAHMERVHLEDCTIVDSFMQGTILSGGHLERGYFSSVRMEGVHLEGGHLQMVEMHACSLDGGHLEGAFFVGAKVGGTLEVEPIADRKILPSFFTGAHMHKTDCTAMWAPECDFEGAYMVETILVGADLQRTNLTRAFLIHADLTDADLRDATLNHTDFTGATLDGTDLRGVDLSTAIGLTLRQLGRARTDEHTVVPAEITRQIEALEASMQGARSVRAGQRTAASERSVA